MTAPIVIESLPGVPSTKRRIELVERKGLGHPDTICDSLVEAVALSLNRMYLEHLGAIALQRRLRHRPDPRGHPPAPRR